MTGLNIIVPEGPVMKLLAATPFASSASKSILVYKSEPIIFADILYEIFRMSLRIALIAYKRKTHAAV